MHVMHEIGRPGSARHLCMHCADRVPQDARGDCYVNIGAVIISVGLVLFFLSIFADSLDIGGHRGFVARQAGILLLAITLLTAAAVIRIGTLATLGLLLLTIALLADYAGIAGHQGFGLRQVSGVCLACVLVAVGLRLGRSGPGVQ